MPRLMSRKRKRTIATKPLAASSSPGLMRYVRQEFIKRGTSDGTSIWQEPIPRHRIPSRNPSWRVGRRDRQQKVHNEIEGLSENLNKLDSKITKGKR